MERQILENTFALIEPQSRQFSRDFYQKLFRRYPKVQKLFARTDMEQQERKIVYSLAMIVESYGKKDALDYLLKNLGKRHLSYKVVAEHYEYVGDILIETLAFYLGEHWTPIVQDVWAKAYSQIVNLMLEGSKENYNTFNKTTYKNKPIKYMIKELRIEAIGKKALNSDKNSDEAVAQKLLKDSHFKEMEEKVGKEKTYEVVSDVLERIRRKQQAKFKNPKKSKNITKTIEKKSVNF